MAARYTARIQISPTPNWDDSGAFLIWQESFQGNNAGTNAVLVPDPLGGSRYLWEAGKLLPGQQIAISRYIKLPENFAGTYYILARINAAGTSGRDDDARFADENDASASGTLFWGNNTTTAAEAQKIMILPKQATNTFRASLSSSGGASSGLSDNPSISQDGRYIAFQSKGQLAGTTDSAYYNIYVRNTEGDTTDLVSVATSGATDGDSTYPVINAGTDAVSSRYVVFQSAASNLAAGVHNGMANIYVRDIQLKTTHKIMPDSRNDRPLPQPDSGSSLPSISADGRYIVFESTATNLLKIASGSTRNPNGKLKTQGVMQIYLYDRGPANESGEFTADGFPQVYLISDQNAGAAFDDPAAAISAASRPKISLDGNHIVFVTKDKGVLGLAANSPFDQIVLATNPATDATGVLRFLPVSRDISQSDLTPGNNASGYPAINEDGSYVAFSSAATNLTLGNSPADSYNVGVPHVFRAAIDTSAFAVTRIVRLNSTKRDNPHGYPDGYDQYRYDADDNALYSHSGFEPDNPLTNPPDLGSLEPSMDKTGNLIAFVSESRDLLPPLPVRSVDGTTFLTRRVANYIDSNEASDVYFYDLSSSSDGDIYPVAQRASVSRFGYEASRWTLQPMLYTTQIPTSRRPVVSADGRFVAFTSDAKGRNGLIFGATNYDYEATNGAIKDVYVFDRKANYQDPKGDLPVVELMPFITNVNVGRQVTFVAQASSTMSAIARVEFFANDVLFATVTTPTVPGGGNFTATWTAPSPGTGNTSTRNYRIEVVAVDDLGVRSAISGGDAITVTAPKNVAPVITVTAPEASDVWGRGSTIPLIASLTPGQDTVSSIEFWASSITSGATLLGTVAIPSDSEDTHFKVNYPVTLAIDSYNITATARVSGAAGIASNALSAAVPVSVIRTSLAATPALPTNVVLTLNPASLSLGQSTSISVSAEAASGSAISEVSIYVDNEVVQTITSFPYTANYTPAYTGTYKVFATVADSRGNMVTTPEQTLTVGEAPVFTEDPTLVINGGNTTISLGESLGFSVTANPPSGVTIKSVTFYVGSDAVGLATAAPWTASYTPTQAGSFTVYAVVLDSLDRPLKTVDQIVTVSPVIPPAVSLSVTPASVEIGSSVTISGTVTVTGATLTSITIYVNGEAWATRSSSPFSATFTPPATGVYAVHAVATDSRGSSAPSNSATVNVTQAPWVGVANEAFQLLYGRDATTAEAASLYGILGMDMTTPAAIAQLFSSDDLSYNGIPNVVISSYLAVMGAYPDYEDYLIGVRLLESGYSWQGYINYLLQAPAYARLFGQLMPWPTGVGQLSPEAWQKHVDEFALRTYRNVYNNSPKRDSDKLALYQEFRGYMGTIPSTDESVQYSTHANAVYEWLFEKDTKAKLYYQTQVAAVILAFTGREPTRAEVEANTAAVQAGRLKDVAEYYALGTDERPTEVIKPVIQSLVAETDSVVVGDQIELKVTLSQGNIPSFQWLKAGKAITPGGRISSAVDATGTTATLVIGDVVPADAAKYTVKVSNTKGVVTSKAVTIKVTPEAPIVPVDRVYLKLGGAATTALTVSNPAMNTAGGVTYYTKGLPKGLKLDKNTGVVTGAVTAKSGEYSVQYWTKVGKYTSETVYQTIIVEDPLPAIDIGTNGQYAWTLGSGVFDESIKNTDPEATGLTYEAKGLPKGLKLDKKTGQISGTITAKPGTYTVTYWSKVGSSKSQPITLTFTVNGFPFEGDYDALFVDSGNQGLPAGKVTVKITYNGAFTGKLYYQNNKTYSLKGTFGLSSSQTSASVELFNVARSGLNLDLYVTSAGKLEVSTLIDNGSGYWVNAQYGFESIKLTNPKAPVRSYTVGAQDVWINEVGSQTFFDPIMADPLQGDAKVSVNAKNVLSFKGKLADGTKITASTTGSDDGSYLLFVNPNKKIWGGYFAGELNLVNNRFDDPDQSDLLWSKPAADNNKIHPTAFGPLDVSIQNK
ncbi:hypothetical protein OPIT5_03295 [Opitutaceae bacterium TAV5]|nr:hypothetical protein OPIT5_03295 [Opitutaceae bacterium TAV5]